MQGWCRAGSSAYHRCKWTYGEFISERKFHSDCYCCYINDNYYAAAFEEIFRIERKGLSDAGKLFCIAKAMVMWHGGFVSMVKSMYVMTRRGKSEDYEVEVK